MERPIALCALLTALAIALPSLGDHATVPAVTPKVSAPPLGAETKGEDEGPACASPSATGVGEGYLESTLDQIQAFLDDTSWRSQGGGHLRVDLVARKLVPPAGKAYRTPKVRRVSRKLSAMLREGAQRTTLFTDAEWRASARQLVDLARQDLRGCGNQSQ